MPGAVNGRITQVQGIVATGIPQLVPHKLQRSPRRVSILINQIDMATPGNYSKVVNAVDPINMDITVLPAGAVFDVIAER